MSDEQTTETVEEAPEVTDAPEGTEAETVEPGGNEDELPDWAKRELKRARDEAAKYRTEKQSFAKAFEGYTDEGRDWVLQNLVPSLVSDYEGTIKSLATELGITKAEAREMVEDATGESGEQAPDPAEVARREAERLWNEKEAARAAAEAQKQIMADVKALGYDTAVDDKGNPTNVDTQYLMLLAARQTNGDLAEAHKIIEAGRDAIYQERVAALEAESKGHVKPAKGGGTPTQADKSWVGDMKATSKAARAYLDAHLGR